MLGSDLPIELLAVPAFEFGEAQVLGIVISLHMMAQIGKLAVSTSTLRAIVNLFGQVVVELMLVFAIEIVAYFPTKVAIYWMMILK